MNLTNRFKALQIAMFAMISSVFALTANAQIDVADGVSALGDVVTAATAIGGAVIGAAAAYIAFRWVKGYLKGA